MSKKLTTEEKEWYFKAIEGLADDAVKIDITAETITYNSVIRSDESHVKSANPEELAHAVMIGLLHSPEYNYSLKSLGHEVYFAHGARGSKADEVDILVYDEDDLPYALIELKAANAFDHDKEDAIKNQLFGTAPLVGSPKLLVYATVEPKGSKPKLKVLCIDYTKHKSYDSWKDEGEPHSSAFPIEYRDLDYEPYVSQGENDLDLNSTQADFRAVAASFHNEFFGEHADNTVFVNLVKCLLAKIHDERTRKKGEVYHFQIQYKNSKPENAKAVFERVNELYRAAYKRFIDPSATEIDDINNKEFSEERVKTVVQALQGISITKGAARNGDIIGAFFEEILRTGFKQDRGMYFTHDNIARFMMEAVDINGLTRSTWQKSNHPDNRLPYIIDPACGSGTFLLHAMHAVTATVKGAEHNLVTDHDSEQFYKARLSNDQPNYWAENFVYGFDPKFIMAITAKVNMVLHGDGSAHIIKDDAFRPFSRYSDVRLRPCSDIQRSISRSNYSPDICESFDVIISNPPFGVTLSPETRLKLKTTFTLPESTPSEGLFIERCFQLLKPNGRLAIVLPESVLNAKEMVGARLFLYRFFNIKSIVSMPRNIFIDTPTLTSLVFAQKKTSKEVELWDETWLKMTAAVETLKKNATLVLRKSSVAEHSADEIINAFLTALNPVIKENSWISKGGKSSQLLRMNQDMSGKTGEEAAEYCRDFIKAAGFNTHCQSYIFEQVTKSLDYEFPVFMIDEVGYKLSKRKEKARPNQLCLFRGKTSKTLIMNMHLAEEDTEVIINTESPNTAIDFIRKSVTWN
jgi:type I restriction enzyme M protein